MSKKFPSLVTKLTNNFNAWIVGSAADIGIIDPRDYDVFVPVEEWHKACLIIPNDFKINTLGGFKVISDGKEIDIFTGNFNEFITRNFFSCAYHPNSGVRIKKV